METKYKEIFKLKKMLDNAGIPYEWSENWDLDPEQVKAFMAVAPDLFGYYHIWYPTAKDGERWISVIEGFGTYGAENDRLEIMGGLTPWEQFSEGNGPKGHLTACNVFGRIKRNWEERQK